jgi:pyruvate-formate lyase
MSWTTRCSPKTCCVSAEELSEQFRALDELVRMAAKYGYDIQPSGGECS